MTVKNKEYWEKRAIINSNRFFSTEDERISQKDKIYSEMSKKITKDVNNFYAKYGEVLETPVLNTDGGQSGEKKALTVTNAQARKKQGNITRLQRLQIQLDRNISEGYKEEEKQLTEYLSNIATDSYYTNMFELQRGIGLGQSFDLLNDRAVMTLISNPVAGAVFSDRFKENRDLLAVQVNRTLEDGIIKGYSNKQMVAFLRKRIDIDKNRADVTIKTELANVMAQSTLKSYEDTNIEKYEYLATLDNRTSDVCQGLDGKVFDVKKAVTGVNYPIMHPRCYDKETEVYTNKGWLKFKELKGEESFLSINPENINEYDWVKSIKNISYLNNEKMISLKSNGFDLLVTQGHKMFVKYCGKDNSGKWRFVNSEKLPKGKNKMYRGLNHVGKEQKFFIGGYEIEPNLYMKFMAWYLSDGSTTKLKYKNSYRIKISQETHNQLMFDTLKELPFKVHQSKDSINIYDYKVCEDMYKYGKCNEKFIPDIIKNSTKELIKVFLESYSIADGTVKKGKFWKGSKFEDTISFFTTSKKLADDLGELVLKVGGRPTFKITKPKEFEIRGKKYKSNFDCWTITWNKKVYVWVDNIKREFVDYKDMVYCVELEKWHTLLVRRNGFVVWSGNCRSSTTPALDDEFKSMITRLARREDGSTYTVPATMTYKEWKKDRGIK